MKINIYHKENKYINKIIYTNEYIFKLKYSYLFTSIFPKQTFIILLLKLWKNNHIVIILNFN